LVTSKPDLATYEEYDEAGGLDVERDPSDEPPEIKQPYDPNSIRVGTKNFSLRNMLDAIEEESLDLTPDFQRLRVWKPIQKAQLIESVLLQIPLPAFYFAEEADGLLRVVDGVQRLSTIHDFVKGKFALYGLEYVDIEGKRFADLPPVWRRRLYNTQIVAHVIDPSTPAPVMYDIFRRINTGGTPLNTQEIRHCMSRDRSRGFLKRLTELPEFNRATGGLRDHRRMVDREVALRFCAFQLISPEAFPGSMDEFLLDVTRQLDDPRQVNEQQFAELERAFQQALANAFAVFNDHAFRKWPLGEDARKPFNRALFESWTVELAQAPEADVIRTAAKIQDAARRAMAQDVEYISSITSATGNRRNVTKRFVTAREIINGAIG
jgi:hypothetical protein